MFKRYRVSDRFDDIIRVSDAVDEKIQGVRRSFQVGTSNNTRPRLAVLYK